MNEGHVWRRKFAGTRGCDLFGRGLRQNSRVPFRVQLGADRYGSNPEFE